MDKIIAIMRLFTDLHASTGGADPVEKLRAWVHTPEGNKTMADVEQVLVAFDFPLVIAIRGKSS